MSGHSAVLQVVILRDGLLVGTEVFVPGQYTLGSSESADLLLDDPSVEGSHAVLYFQNGRVAIQDSGGHGGVFVNGHRVSACEVRPVDEVACGPFTLKVRVLAQKPAPKGAPPPEVAALLKDNPTLREDAKPAAGTMLSARRLAAAPKPATPKPAKPAAPPADPITRPTPHLRAVTPLPVHDDIPTEAVNVPPVLADVTVPATKPKPQRPSSSKKRAEPRRPSPPAPPSPELKKGPTRLFFELYWGDVRREAHSFGRLPPKKPVTASHDEHAQVPLWGFKLSKEPFVLAESHGKKFRVYVPERAVVETRQDGDFYPVAPDQLEKSGGRRYLTLSSGMAARLSEGEMSLVAYVQPMQRAPFVSPLHGLPWLAITLLVLFLSAGGAFLYFGPKPAESADFQNKNLAPVAVRLIAPEPKKKEEAKKKLDELKTKAEDTKKKEKKAEVAKKEPVKREKEKLPPAVAPPPETKALKALSKLTAAGPATGSLLAAVDKLGNGPGSKHVKDSNYKLSGLIGKAPIANAGLGTFGLGGGGGGGFGTKGAEILRGPGGGGIGALGAGGVGRGKVGGTVTRASARSVAVQGSIDREAVAKTVNAHLQEVRACYERALLRDPGLAGKVVLEWTIATNGKVVAAKTKSSTLRNAAVEGCILGHLKSWIFPPAKGGVVIVSYPFMFNSVGY